MAEFVAAAYQEKMFEILGRVESSFNSLDLNSDKEIDFEELRMLLPPGTKDEEVRDVLARADVIKKDGKISLQEFRAALASTNIEVCLGASKA